MQLSVVAQGSLTTHLITISLLKDLNLSLFGLECGDSRVTYLLLRACAFDFPLTVPRSRSGGYDERKLEQTSKPANPRRQTAFYENTRRQIAFPRLTNFMISPLYYLYIAVFFLDYRNLVPDLS